MIKKLTFRNSNLVSSSRAVIVRIVGMCQIPLYQIPDLTGSIVIYRIPDNIKVREWEYYCQCSLNVYMCFY